jgi:hypothetical protein
MIRSSILISIKTVVPYRTDTRTKKLSCGLILATVRTRHDRINDALRAGVRCENVEKKVALFFAWALTARTVPIHTLRFVRVR